MSEYDESDKELINKIPKDILGSIEVTTVTGVAIYWRKANAIHNWFVENVQGGIDECQTSFVAYERLIELHEAITTVLDDNDLASEVLPSASGFFFGATEYDEYYFRDLKDTKADLEKLFKEDPMDIDNNIYPIFDYDYQASW